MARPKSDKTLEKERNKLAAEATWPRGSGDGRRGTSLALKNADYFG